MSASFDSTLAMKFARSSENSLLVYSLREVSPTDKAMVLLTMKEQTSMKHAHKTPLVREQKLQRMLSIITRLGSFGGSKLVGIKYTIHVWRFVTSPRWKRPTWLLDSISCVAVFPATHAHRSNSTRGPKNTYGKRCQQVSIAPLRWNSQEARRTHC